MLDYGKYIFDNLAPDSKNCKTTFAWASSADIGWVWEEEIIAI